MYLFKLKFNNKRLFAIHVHNTTKNIHKRFVYKKPFHDAKHEWLEPKEVFFLT